MLLHSFAILALLAFIQLALCAEDYYKVCAYAETPVCIRMLTFIDSWCR